jgi:hypothetical protein
MTGSPERRLSNETQNKTSGAVAVEDTVEDIAAISIAWSRRSSGAVGSSPPLSTGPGLTAVNG